jgi:hypothetical protein
MTKDEKPTNGEHPDEVTAVAVAPDRIFELAIGFMAAGRLPLSTTSPRTIACSMSAVEPARGLLRWRADTGTWRPLWSICPRWLT